MALIDNFLFSGAAQYIDDVGHAKPFLAAGNAGKEFLRFDGPVFQGWGVDAVVAAIAPLAQHLPEVAELNPASADGAFGIVNHLSQLLTGNPLLVLITFLTNQIINRCHIPVRKVNGAVGRLPIPARTPRLLVVALKVSG